VDETVNQLNALRGQYRRMTKGDLIMERLAAADPPPLELWYQGEIPPPPYLTVVGPRQPSDTARVMVESVVRRLAPHVTVGSGLARGIDTAALTSALAVGGRVIAIVPTGLHEAVSRGGAVTKRITQSGAVVAERLFVSHLSKSHFLFRNRLLAGLADAVYIPEAGERSGTFNTITHALKQGVDVLISPGDVNRATCAGSNRLIQEGAAIILRADDVALCLGLKLPSEAVGPISQAIKKGAGTVEEIAAELRWNIPFTIRELAVAQSRGWVEQDWLGRFRLLAGDPSL